MRLYWAHQGAHTVGPFTEREAALDAYRQAHPFSGEDYEAHAKRNQIMTGYGETGPVFDLRWHAALEKGQDNE